MEAKLLSEMSWPEVERLLRFDDRLIIVTGATEQHGRHLPLGTDVLIPWELARRLSEASGVPVAPALPVGMSEMHMAFPGTLTLSQDTLQSVYLEVIQSAYRQGWRRFLVLDGHGGNRKAWEWVMALTMKIKPDLRFHYATWWREPEVQAISQASYGRTEGHAGLEETGAVLAIAPETVRQGAAQATPDDGAEDTSPVAFRERFPHGAIGTAPGAATAAYGEAVLEALTQKYLEWLHTWPA